MAQPPSREQTKLVVFNFLQYLADLRAADTSLGELEALDVATQCLIDTFGIQLDSAEQKKQYSIKPMTLPQVLEGTRMFVTEKPTAPTPAAEVEDARWTLFLNQLKKAKYFTADEGTPEYQKQLDHAKAQFKAKVAAKPAAAPAPAAAAPTSVSAGFPVTAAAAAYNALNAEDRKKRIDEAEKYKTEGNQKLTDRQYHAAMEAYTKAIELNPTNAIYFGNRAAAYEFLGDSEKAIQDCKESIRIDPNYAKAYSRLGLSYFSLGCYKDAIEQYRKAVQLDQNNAAYRESLTKAELKLAQHPDAPLYSARAGSKPAAAPAPAPAAAPAAGAAPIPPVGNLPPFDPEAMKGMMNDLGGLGNIMSNPNFLGMAQKMMSDPQFMSMAQSMLSNPEMASMLGNLSGQKKS